MCRVDYEEPSESIFHNFMYGNYKEFTEDSKEQSDKWFRQLKDFVVNKLGLSSMSDASTEALIGLSFRAIIEIEESEEYGKKNRIKKFV
jgi:hypothetical protein